MVVVMRFKIVGNLGASIKKYNSKIIRAELAGERAIRKAARFAAREYIRQAKVARIKEWRGKLFTKTRALQRSKRVWDVVMPEYGVHLDSMSDHFVSFKRGRTITLWAKDKGLYQKGIRTIKVHKHPFMDRAESNIRRESMKIWRTELKRFK